MSRADVTSVSCLSDAVYDIAASLLTMKLKSDVEL